MRLITTMQSLQLPIFSYNLLKFSVNIEIIISELLLTSYLDFQYVVLNFEFYNPTKIFSQIRSNFILKLILRYTLIINLLSETF